MEIMLRRSADNYKLVEVVEWQFELYLLCGGELFVYNASLSSAAHKPVFEAKPSITIVPTGR